MKLGNTNALWALFLLPTLGVLWVVSGRKARNLVQKLVAARLQRTLVDAPSGRLPRFALLLAGLGLCVFALSRPQWGEVTSETKGRGRDVLILIDVSRSMLANDLPPSRLQRAKLAAEDLVRQLGGDRIGIVAFAGTAFLQAPITADHSAVLTAIQELDPEIIPQQGTNICAALQCADEAFDRTEGGQRALVLISDGEELEADAVAMAKELAAKMRIFTLGVGSPEGSVLMVPSPKGGLEYIRDGSGNPVLSKLDESRLEEIASVGGGFYSHLSGGLTEVKHIAEEGIGVMDEHEVSVEVRTRAVERFQWPLGGALACLALGMILGERPRRRLAALIALTLWHTAEPSQAAAEGRHLYEAGNYPGAQQAFSEELSEAPDSPERAFNLGAAAYKNKKWAEAIEAFGKALNTSDPELRKRAEYNLANTLVQQARQGRRGQDNKTLEQAVAHYDEALRRDGQFEDAQFNRNFVKRLLEEKPPEQQKGGKSSDKDKKDKKEKKEGEQQDKQDGSSQDDNNKDGEQQEGQQGKDGKDGKSGEQDKQAQQNKSEEGGDKKGQDSAQNGKPSEPVEEKAGDKKERGELKDSPTVDKPDRPDKNDPEAAALQAGNSAMTREQAAALVESLRSEDRRVQVWAPNKTEPSKEGSKTKTW